MYNSPYTSYRTSEQIKCAQLWVCFPSFPSISAALRPQKKLAKLALHNLFRDLVFSSTFFPDKAKGVYLEECDKIKGECGKDKTLFFMRGRNVYHNLGT